jgi:hypothetical protein
MLIRSRNSKIRGCGRYPTRGGSDRTPRNCNDKLQIEKSEAGISKIEKKNQINTNGSCLTMTGKIQIRRGLSALSYEQYKKERVFILLLLTHLID